jgi:hypothetical protein
MAQLHDIIETWPPAAPAVLTDAHFSVWLAVRHLGRIKSQFETSPAFDRAFLRSVAAAVATETPIGAERDKVERDLAAVMAEAGAVRFRTGETGFDHAGTLRSILRFILIAAHQSDIAKLIESRRDAAAELAGVPRQRATAYGGAGQAVKSAGALTMARSASR